MLLTLNIKNVALIEDLTINTDNGMTVMTGETGAGKSVIIDSINMILGARTNKNIVRYGETKAVIQAVFSNDKNVDLESYGIEADDTVIITREINADGRSTCRINGIIMPQNIVREITQSFVNIHGQHDNQALLIPSKHISFIDKYAKNEDLLTEYAKIYENKLIIENKIDSLKMDEAEKARRIDLLSYQVNEIEKSQIKPGEKEELTVSRILMQSGEKISSSINEAYEHIYNSETSAYDRLSSACDALSKISHIDEKFDSILQKISGIRYEIEDVSHEMYESVSSNEYSEDDLNCVEERLDIINRLERKYGGSETAILEYYENAKKELDEISDSDAENLRLEKELDEVIAGLRKVADELTSRRQKAGRKLSSEVEKELFELDMPKVKFKTEITQLSEFSKNGTDRVEFLISPNPGEPEKGLDKIASGGELSRVMLAIKTILADSDNVETLIFDEVDTGVSGSAAKKIAEKLSALSRKKQVICVSHQPQIAAAANMHYKIRKTETDGRNTTAAVILSDEERIVEIARIIDGETINETSKEHAKQMILQYRKVE